LETFNEPKPLSFPGNSPTTFLDVHGSWMASHLHSSRNRTDPVRFVAISPSSPTFDSLRLCHPRKPPALDYVCGGFRKGNRRFQVFHGPTNHRFPRREESSFPSSAVGILQSQTQGGSKISIVARGFPSGIDSGRGNDEAEIGIYS